MDVFFTIIMEQDMATQNKVKKYNWWEGYSYEKIGRI